MSKLDFFPVSWLNTYPLLGTNNALLITIFTLETLTLSSGLGVSDFYTNNKPGHTMTLGRNSVLIPSYVHINDGVRQTYSFYSSWRMHSYIKV